MDDFFNDYLEKFIGNSKVKAFDYQNNKFICYYESNGEPKSTEISISLYNDYCKLRKLNEAK